MHRAVSRRALAVLLIFGLPLAVPAVVAAAEEALPSDPAPAGADLFAGETVLRREALLRAVRDRNPNLAAARSAWQAALARPEQAGALPNPMASSGTAPLSIGSSDVPFGITFEVRQRLPYPGKRQARAALAEAEAEARFHDLRRAVLELTTLASQLYDDYWLAERTLEVNAEHQRLLKDFHGIATARYSAGLALQQDPLQAEVEAAKLLIQRSELQTARRVATARLNALLHRAPRLPLPPPATPGEPAPVAALAQMGPAPTGDPAGAPLADAGGARPELASQDAMIRARQEALKLAILESKPDFEAMGAYSSMWAMTEHRWMAGLAVDLPLWKRKNQAARAEAEAALAGSRQERLALEDEVRAEVQIAVDRYRESLLNLEIQRARVLPAARDQIRAARAGFETGSSSALGVIEAERSLREAELTAARLLAQAHQREAELDRALGRLPGGLAFEPETEPDEASRPVAALEGKRQGESR
jgi:outer membrane protein, heavy metal efflux system